MEGQDKCRKKCVSRQVGGIGMGKARFLDRFRAVPTCDGQLIAGLMKNVRDDIARGNLLDEDVRVDAKYGYLISAHLDMPELFDQGWRCTSKHVLVPRPSEALRVLCG
jgi:hypothetical protein